MLGEAGAAGVSDDDGAAAGAEWSLGAGAGVGNGMVSARIAAAPASQPDSNTALHTARRMPAMSFSAFARFPLCSSALAAPPCGYPRPAWSASPYVWP